MHFFVNFINNVTLGLFTFYILNKGWELKRTNPNKTIKIFREIQEYKLMLAFGILSVICIVISLSLKQ